MPITDYTYYTRGKKSIPNVRNLNYEVEGVPSNGVNLSHFINKYERELLINCLNVTLYNELQQALVDLPNADQKYINLIEGTTYIKDDITYIWDGLRGFEQDSLVAFFVFCRYMEVNESYYSTTGVISSNASNSVAFDPTRKYIDAWYSFLNKYQNEHEENSYSYIVDGNTGFVCGIDYYTEDKENLLVTLEQYLKDHESDFEGYQFKRYEGTNSLL